MSITTTPHSAGTPGQNKKPSQDVLSVEMKGLLEHKKQINEWLVLVESRIWDMEDTYLDETPAGNIIKGWEMDGKPPLKSGPSHPASGDRLFSYSSYQTFMEKSSTDHSRKSICGGSSFNRVDSYGMPKNRIQPTTQKKKYEEWEGQPGDY
jgi:hypothetical protein